MIDAEGDDFACGLFYKPKDFWVPHVPDKTKSWNQQLAEAQLGSGSLDWPRAARDCALPW